MERKQKSFAVGLKSKRKISLRGATSEPKNLTLNIANIPPIHLDNHEVLHSKSKFNPSKDKNIIPELNNADPTSPPSKKKAKKASRNNETTEAEPKDKKRKKRSSDIFKAKRSSDIAQLKKKKTQNVLLAETQKKKRKESELMAELHNLKGELGIPEALKPEVEEQSSEEGEETLHETPMAKVVYQAMKMHDMGDKFPILNDKKLIEKFLKVPLSNNQKGRIRQAIKLSLQGSTAKIFPEIINGKIQAILSSSTDLTDSELRRIRILHNMLKTAIESPEKLQEENSAQIPSKKPSKKKKEDGDTKVTKKDREGQKKVKGPKRYVVFLGNLPLDVTKENIMDHFREFNEQIVSIRLPKCDAGKKSAIAYVELSNEPSYELALSKHHSMLGNKRIRVLYTTQQKGKITRAEAKSKSAKMIALQKAGKLVGSVPATKRRSHRRAIMKRAKAKEAAAGVAVENK